LLGEKRENNLTKVVILAGGLGTRLKEETESKPKPMVEIGGLPIIWHIIDNFRSAGFNDFIVATGYKGNVIKSFFSNLDYYFDDFTINYETGAKTVHLSKINRKKDFKISVINTGFNTMTGGRISRLKKYIGNEDFICTYGDGLSNIDPNKLVEFHKRMGKVATLTAVHPRSQFGQLEFDKKGTIISFHEKQITKSWVNGGFFVFSQKIFEYLSDNDVLEDKPIQNLILDQQISAFQYEGFWHPMDTYRDFMTLNEMWSRGETPWVTNLIG
jgi:glucose-1-phosphate cytidylyltransferase